ncbi:MAG: DUF4105 domain-containing protein [Flavobacteriaceae bacterium]|nr:DUF4105 domain-containing protein [Flavobacteriaceae bacterium]MDH3795396.1 DUF4105 domain-containing protein [Flavobacteriaceae bacterium]
MHRYIGLLLLSLCLGLQAYSRPVQLSAKAEISVLTCGPGDDLYATFGHSAIRVQDPNLGIDIVYNYGSFDFNTPNFYSKFAKGQLLYSLSRERFENFLYTYQLENRWVKEQILDLDTREKNALFQFLENNYKPENRKYKYDFLFDNCSTKIPYVISSVFGSKIGFTEDHLDETSTFRDLIQENLYRNSWSSLGIDLALGADIDRNAAVKEHMFLPNYVFKQFEHTEIDSKPLVKREREVLDASNGDNRKYFTTSPLFWLLLLFFFVATITFIDFRNLTRSRWLDVFLFLISGVIGLFIIFLWFFTDHTATANNANLLWALPTHLGLIYILGSKKTLPDWFHKYALVSLILMATLFLFWVFGIQKFSPVLLPLLFALLLRMAYLWRFTKA